MHTRHNSNPGNGNRFFGSSNSTEGPTRGPGFYSSESRSFHCRFSRNQSQNHRQNFHRPPPAHPMPLRADVYMEVGRLAAEYLVSKGVLPRNVFRAKWQNESLKKPLSEFPEFRPHDEENMQFPGEARTSALACLGNNGFGGESGRRKYNDDYGTAEPRNRVRGKRKGGSSRNYSSDWDREYMRTGSWSDRHRDRTSLSSDLDRGCSSKHHEEHPDRKDNCERMAGDYYSSSRRPEEKQFGKDDDRMDVDNDTGSRLHKEPVFGKGDRDMFELTGTSATPLKGVDNEDSESEIKGQQIEELSELKDPDIVMDTRDVTNEEIKTDSLDLVSSQQMTDNTLIIPEEEAEVDPRNKVQITGEINDPSKDKTVKEIISGDQTPKNFMTHASLSERSGTDLKALCKFANVPTRIRSSLAKGAKKRSVVSVEGIDQIGLIESMRNDNNIGVSTDYGSSSGCDESKVLNYVLTPQRFEGEKGLHSDNTVGPVRELESGNSLSDGKPDSASPQDQANSAGPESLEDGMLENDQSLKGDSHDSGSGDPVVEKKGEKRQPGGTDIDGQHARRKEWLYQSTKVCLSPASRNAGERSNLTNPISSKVDTINDNLLSGENATTVHHSFPVDNF